MEKFRTLVIEDLEEINEILKNIIPLDNSIYSDLNDFINNSSKRIRSVLCLLYLRANNKTVNNDLYLILAAAELIHNASLLHDDVIDNSDTRRGNKTFNKIHSSKVAILSGDYLLTKAVKMLMQLNNSEILQLFLRATERMANAEIKQFLYRGKAVGISEYTDIIEGKTASLFEAIIESAAIITCSDRMQAKNIGRKFGILFQLNNDMLPESALNDKKNGIKTIENILGIEKTNNLKDNYKQELSIIIRSLPNKEYLCELEALVNKL